MKCAPAVNPIVHPVSPQEDVACLHNIKYYCHVCIWSDFISVFIKTCITAVHHIWNGGYKITFKIFKNKLRSAQIKMLG